MGIDISGGMIIGLPVDNIYYDDEVYENVWDYADDSGMTIYSKWFDADTDGQVMGFRINNVDVTEDSINDWLLVVKQKGEKFTELTGEIPKLIGMQNVY